MRTGCFFSPCVSRPKIIPDDEDEGSVDSEPYSPQNVDFLQNLANVESIILSQMGEKEHSGCTERDEYRIKTAASMARSNSLAAKELGSKAGGHIIFEKVSQFSRCPSLSSNQSGGFVSTANGKQDDKTSTRSAMPTAEEHRSLYSPSPSFRWDYEEPYRVDRTPEFSTRSSSMQKSASSTSSLSKQTSISGDQKKVMNLQFTEDSETVGCYIHVSRTNQRILNHYQLRPFMDELKRWSMQVPSTSSLRYKHSTGVDVSLPWPDLRTGSIQEIEKFVDSVNRIEGRKVFYCLRME